MKLSTKDLGPYQLWRSNQGWRARIGVIYPGPGWHHIGDFYKLAPNGVAVGGIGVPRHKDESAEEMLHLDEQVVEKAKMFVSYSPDVILWNCTAGSFLKGKDHDAELINQMEEATGGITCTSTSTSLCLAFRTTDVKKIAMCTPYPNDVNDVEKRYFEDNGFEIVNCIGLDLVDNNILANLAPSVLYKLARTADVPEAEAVFISCTGLDALDVIDALEQDIGKPVFTSNQAACWNAFRLAKIGAPIQGYGSLLSRSRV
ncbi:MAG: Asp/Glu racemase [Clostridiales Family XIII bacterium]|jgi:maleate isomerase|nr:Asp/Glu racemase [Clostridiales Family XIII bacterium]